MIGLTSRWFGVRQLAEQIENIAGLIETIRTVREKFPKAIWYRGQSQSAWQLLPGLLRQTFNVSESTLLARFKQSAAMLIERRPQSSFDWIFLMQHYGVPTRLLDWSENPLVALFFAVDDPLQKFEDDDASLWILRPNDLNKHAHINDKDEGDYIPSFDDDEVEGYSTEQIRSRSRLELFPIATIATRNNPRIQAQLGTFTIHHNARTPIENVGDGLHCDKYIIPAIAKARIREELLILGVNRFSLFPEMDSVGGILRELM